MSVIEKLDSVLALIEKARSRSNWVLRTTLNAAAADLLRDHGPAIRQDMIDARRYRELAVMEDQPWVTFKFQADGLTAYGPVLPRNRKPWLDAAIDARLASDSEGGSDGNE